MPGMGAHGHHKPLRLQCDSGSQGTQATPFRPQEVTSARIPPTNDAQRSLFIRPDGQTMPNAVTGTVAARERSSEWCSTSAEESD